MNTQQDPNKVIYEEEFTGPTKELRILGMVSYFPGGFSLAYILWLHDQPFVLFHVKQGFVMFSIAILLALLPIPGTSGLAFFLYLVFGGWHWYQAYQGKEYQMKWVTSLLASLNSTDESKVQNSATQQDWPQSTQPPKNN